VKANALAVPQSTYFQNQTLNNSEFITEREPRLRIVIPMVVAVAFLMEQLDATILTTAIPDIARSLATTAVRMNLAVTAYVLTLAVFIPLSGWFADRYGMRKIFVLALGTFTVGSALCGLADSFAMLVATRVLQGLGGAMMTPVGRLILLRSFPRSKLVTAMTYMTVPAILGPVIGPLVGGLLTTYSSWRWIFYVNLPFGVIGMALALRFMQESPGDPTADFDFKGFVLFGCGIGLVQVGIENIGRQTLSLGLISVMFLAAGGLLYAFNRYARHIAVPVVDLTLFRLRCFSVGSLAGGLCRIALNGAPYLLPLMLQIGFGLSPVTSGSIAFMTVAGAMAARLVVRRALRRFGFAPVLTVSALAGALVLTGCTFLTPTTPHWVLALYAIVFGLCRSSQFMTSNTLSYADIPAARLSQATSLGGLVQQLTVSFGVSFGAVLLDLVTPHGTPLTTGRFHEVFLLTAFLPLLALPGFARLRPEDGAEVSGHRPSAGK
jgi:EmrB/QacA subfamily drug resistance transporter